jgi:HAD superfamily hydrolase (TIGR01509 family)
MDGVLVDSEPLHKRAKEEALRQFGIVLRESTYDSYKGRPDATMMQEIIDERGGPAMAVADVLRLKHEIFEAIEHELQPVQGAVDFLRWAASHYRIALATSATPRNRAAALKVLGVSELFEAVVDSSHFQHPKPDPEAFLVALRELRLGAADCWVIEDSVNGVRAAKSAGCLGAAITTTFDSELLRNAGADLIVDSFTELRRKLEQVEAASSREQVG